VHACAVGIRQQIAQRFFEFSVAASRGLLMLKDLMMHFFHLADRILFKLVSAIAQLALVASAFAAFYQVIARFVLHTPSDWSEVSTRALLIWAVLLGLALAFREGAMISVELLRNSLKGRAFRALEGLIALVCFSFLCFLAWIGGAMTWRVRFQNVPSLDISISWIYVAIPIGAGLAAIAVLARWLGGDEPPAVRNDAQG